MHFPNMILRINALPGALQRKSLRTLLVAIFITASIALLSFNFQSTGLELSSGKDLLLALAAVMILDIVVGPVVAIASAILICLYAMQLGGSWHVPALLFTSVISAELLRAGLRPILVTGLQFMATFAVSSIALHGALNAADWAAMATSLVEVSASIAATIMVLLVMPRRSRYFPARCRIRWDHVIFVLVIGSTSITVLSLFQGVERSTAVASEALFTRLFWLVSIVHVLNFAATGLFQVASRSGRPKIRSGSRNSRWKSSRRRYSPLEVTVQALGATREARQLRRHAIRAHRNLTNLQRRLKYQDSKLHQAEHALHRKTALLARAVHEREIIQARLSSIMELSPDVIISADRDGHIDYVNRSVVGLLGFQPAQLIGQSIETLAPSLPLLSHPLILTKQAAQPGQPSMLVAAAPVRCADDNVREFSIRVHEFTVSGSKNYSIQLRNAGQMKHALTALKRARAAVTAARHSSVSFIGAMSHELRTPLHGLIATLDMLRDETLSEAGAQRLAVAKTSARSLLKVANDILDLTRMDSGAFSLERQRFSLKQLMQQVVAEATAQASAAKLQLSYRMLGGFAPSFFGDPQRIKQILGNLVSNALKFTEAGAVQIEARFDGKMCMIDVADTGKGIPQDKTATIFEPFVQAHASRQRYGGEGLGLSICRRLSEAMGGKLLLLRTGPTGSTFRLTLTLDTSDEPVAEDQSLRIFKNPRGRILAVEDHPANQFVVESMLDALKCPATIAPSGAEALALLETQEFDLILMDCQMPDMDGYETTRRIRKLLKKRIPVIAMTANAMLDDRHRCLEAGMDDFLSKPFGRSELNDLLCKWLAPNAAATGAGSLTETIRKLSAMDQEIFTELWQNLQWQLPPMRRICETFLSTARTILLALDNADRGPLERQLHTLLGAAGMIGARQIERLAAELQTATKQRRSQDLQQMQRLLAQAVQDFDKEFNRNLEAAFARD